MRQNNILKKSLVLWIALAFVLAACSQVELTATPAPTANSAPTQSATISPAAAKTTAPAASATLPQRVKGTLLLATTTSTRDTGLLDFLLPIFTQGTGIPIHYIAVGTGQALQMGKDGNVDVLLVHSRAAELAFMESKDGVRREDVMYNDFVIVGPASDPAKISGMKSALDAFKAIAAAQAPFVSRGDQSGTNTKELAIWKSANITPRGDWYINAGQGMGAVLLMADEKNAYTLSDRATYLTQSKKGLQLRILVQSGKD
ncbi:MAG TPA: substrate-binding domain-containing protein, partial [Anaerolineaceae bacterium]